MVGKSKGVAPLDKLPFLVQKDTILESDEKPKQTYETELN